jgi:hypothetical protein
VSGVRIRWRGVARVAAIVLVALLVLRLLPALLHAPEPPPLGADVGLPKAKPAHVVPRVVRETGDVPRPRKTVPDAPAATARIGARTRRSERPHRRPRRPPKVDKPAPWPIPEPVESAPPPTQEYVPPPAPEAVPEPLPEPPSTPGDGSQEFAPR